MAHKKARPEFWYSEEKQMYRKRFRAADGRQHEAWGKTQSECRARVQQMQEEIQFKVSKRPVKDMYFYQYAAIWYKLKKESVKPVTCERYRTNINRHICPVLGSFLLSEITRDDVLLVLKECSNLSKGTQHKIINTMQMIFRAAQQSGYIEKSPCVDIKPNGAKPKKREALTKAQQAAFLSSVKGTKAETFSFLCYYAGLRREEALGLCWDCVYLDTCPAYISIKRAVNWDNSGRPVLVSELKSDSSFRDIPIPKQLQEHLQNIRQESGAVICNRRGGIMSKQAFRLMWGDIAPHTVHSFKVTPHMLRHTYITNLILAGANIKEVQYLAGHSTVALTLDIYTHLTDNSPQSTKAAIEKAFASV